MKKKILFHRDFKGFTGGHLKVWDYFQHVNSSEQFQAEIFMTKESTWKNNPWKPIKDQCLKKWNPNDSDMLFLAGLDWLALSEEQRKSPPSPVINLIQGLRHTQKDNPLSHFLKYPALRVCVSQEVADALQKTGLVNGEIIVNTNGINLTVFPPPIEKDIPLLIVGLKAPELSIKLSNELSNIGINNILITKNISRESFLQLLNRSKIAVLLPQKQEGFYLPALEAMALQSLVICPDCIGNRSFCIDDVSCVMPQYSQCEIKNAILYTLKLPETKKDNLINNAYTIALKNTIERERKLFLKLLTNL